MHSKLSYDKKKKLAWSGWKISLFKYSAFEEVLILYDFRVMWDTFESNPVRTI